jgi:hypothetical protein
VIYGVSRQFLQHLVDLFRLASINLFAQVVNQPDQALMLFVNLCY